MKKPEPKLIGFATVREADAYDIGFDDGYKQGHFHGQRFAQLVLGLIAAIGLLGIIIGTHL